MLVFFRPFFSLFYKSLRPLRLRSIVYKYSSKRTRFLWVILLAREYLALELLQMCIPKNYDADEYGRWEAGKD